MSNEVEVTQVCKDPNTYNKEFTVLFIWGK